MRGILAVERAQTLQCPKGMQRAGIQAQLIRGLILGQLNQRRNHVLFVALYQQPLSGDAPE